MKAPRPVGGPMAANHALAAIRRMFGWSVERDIIAKSPVDGVRPPAPAVARDHVLTEHQLSRLYVAAAGDGGAYVRALVLSAQRRTEVATMRWSDLDLDRQVWTLPLEFTKNKREHVVPLSPALVEVLTSLPRMGAYVFSSTGGKRPLSGFSKLKTKMDRLAEFEDWRFHDIRRSAATRMAQYLKVADSTIGRVLNHAESGVTRKHYNKYDYLDEKRQALDAWASHVEKLARPNPISPASVPEVHTDDNWVEWLDRLNGPLVTGVAAPLEA